MFIGIDGCHSGWCAAAIKKDDALNFFMHKELSKVLLRYASADLILIDMPLGLKESGKEERQCDQAARKLLNKRFKSSIFRVPARRVIFEDAYPKASALNYVLTGKRLSKQVFHILPKMRELHEYLSNNEFANLKEAHPELCFKMIAGHDLCCNKKNRSGFLERIEIMKRFDSDIEQKVQTFKSMHTGLKKDDILDCAILAISAKIGFLTDSVLSVPDTVENDRYGTRMQISYVKI